MRIDGPTWDGEAVLDTDQAWQCVCLSFELGDADDEDEVGTVVIMRLEEITIRPELVLLRRTADADKYAVNWDSSLHAKREAIDILQGWIAELERQIEQDKKAKAEETP